MANHTITISVSIDTHGNADFTVSPSAKRIYDDDHVTWISTDGPFAIQFQDGTPFSDLDMRASTEDSINFATETHKVRDNVRGHFHYSVAVCKDGQVYLDSACPELIAN
jgi:hypothetical protein